MKQRDYSSLMAQLSEEYARYAPRSAALHQQAKQVLVDGGSHDLRLMEPFPPRVRRASGAWIEDEDGHQILDFWQGHHTNILGHNPPIVTEALSELFATGYGLQDGFPNAWQIEVAEILCRQTGHERVRFTTSGTLATMYSIMLARAYTGRELVLKAGGGWHGGHPWGLKGVGWRGGFAEVDSAGLPAAVTDNVIITGFNHPEELETVFREEGNQLACFILEPVIGAGGLMPATREYIELARRLTEEYGVILILDEVISGFRFRAGDSAGLYGVRGDLTTLGKIIGGGMPVAAVAGRADIMSLAGRAGGRKVKFAGGTYSGHPSSMLAARTMLTYLVENEVEVYSILAEMGAETRQVVTRAFADEGIHARFAGDRSEVLPQGSLHMLLFPYEEGLSLSTPEEIHDPAICDVALGEVVMRLAMLLEDVHVMHGLGSTTTAHTSEDIQRLGEAYRQVARRVKPYL